jgi:hypothetical protein
LVEDEHPTRDYIPCEGVSWEPRESGNEKREIPT